MHQLRKWLTALVAGAVCVMGAATPAAALGPDRLPITVANQSGRGEQVFVHVLGTNLATGKLGWVDGGGTFREAVGVATDADDRRRLDAAGNEVVDDETAQGSGCSGDDE